MRMRTDVWRRATTCTLGAALVLVAAAAHAASLKIDPEHSTVGFRVRHLISTVNGRFNEFSDSIEYDAENLSVSSVKATIQAASVDTNVAARDKDLRSKRFFDVEKHPTLEFVEFRSQRAVIGQHLAQLHEYPNHVHTDLDCAIGVQNCGCHDGAMFCKCMGANG